MISIVRLLGLSAAMPTNEKLSKSILSFGIEERSSDSHVRRDASQLWIGSSDSQYYVHLNMGSPSWHDEKFKIDTGISDTYLQVDSQQESELPALSKNFKRINYGPSFRNTFQDGTRVRGYWATDTFYVSDKPFEVQFGVSTEGNGTNTLGLGPRNGEAFVVTALGDGTVMPTYSNFLERMKEEGLIQRKTVALWLEGARYGDPGMVFGGIDHTRYTGPLYLVPMRDSHNIQFPNQNPRTSSIILDKIQIDAYESHSEIEINSPVLLDSGSLFSYLPQQVVDDLSETFNAERRDDLGLYLVDCNHSGNVSFTFSGAQIQLDANDLIAPWNQDGIPWGSCILPVKSTDQKWQYSLGSKFLRSVFTILDMESHEVALAKAVKGNQVPPYNDLYEITTAIPAAVRAPNY